MKNLFFALFLIVSVSLSARPFSIDGYVSEVNTSMIPFSKEGGGYVNDNLVHNRLNLRIEPIDGLSLNIGMRNRLMSGRRYDDSFFRNQIEDDTQGALRLSWNWIQGKGMVLNTTLDRLNLLFEKGAFRIQLGRQRINWAQCMVWNPNDLFNGYSFFDLDYPERQGTDAVRLTYYLSELSSMEAVANYSYQNRWSGALLYRFNSMGTDFQFLAGYLQGQDFVVGGGFSGEIKGVNLRGELSYFYPLGNDYMGLKEQSGAVSLGVDKVFSEGLMLSGEVLWSSSGRNSSRGGMQALMNTRFSPKNLSPSEWSFCAQLTYPATQLLSLSFATLYYLDWQSFYLAPALQWSAMENLSVSFSSQFFLFGSDELKKSNLGMLYARITYNF